MDCPHTDRELEACLLCGAQLCVDCRQEHRCQMSEEDPDSADERMEIETQYGESMEDSKPDEIPKVVLSRTMSFETVAIPNGEITIAIDKPSPKVYPFRCLLWNVANLGGKFGYPIERDQSVIDAIAWIIHTADPDVAAILEVLHHGAPQRPPKEPVAPSEKGSRETACPLVSSFHKAFGVDVGSGGHFDLPDPDLPKRRTKVNAIVGQWFAARLQDAVWPGANVDMAPFEKNVEDAKLTFGEGQLAVETLNKAFERVSERIKEWAPRTEEGTDGGGVSRVRGTKTPPHHKLSQLIPILVEEGYTHFLDSYAANYKDRDKDEEDGLTLKEMQARDVACDQAVKMLPVAAGDALVAFLKALVATTKQSGNDQPACWNILVNANRDLRLKDYKARLEKYEESVKRRPAGDSHDGIREFLRIRDALNKLAGDAYDSWPAEPPKPDAKSIYTQGETYGILWRKAVFEVDPKECQYVSAVAEGVKFEKREPLRVPLRLKGRPDAPPLHLVAWHSPAPSTANRDARSKDFPAFIEYCQQERQAGRLGLLLSDLNVNTFTKETNVEHCSKPLSIPRLFDGICGFQFNMDAFDAQFDAHSTMVVSKFRSGLFDEFKRGLGSGDGEGMERIFDDVEKFRSYPQLRYGASAYDKILTICVRSASGSWSLLQQQRAYVVPVPYAVAIGGEESLLRDVKELPAAIKPFAFLLKNKAPEVLLDLRKYAEKPNAVKVLRDLMPIARNLSDHLPLAAEFHLVDGDGTGMEIEELFDSDEIMETEPTTAGSSDLDELEKLARSYETAAGEARPGALDDMLAWFNETWPDEMSVPAEASARVQRAIESVEIADRKKQYDADDHHKTRPDLGNGLPKRSPGEQLADRLRTGNDEICPNAGGGDCLFRSLAQLVFGDEALHGQVRHAVINHLEDLLAGLSLDDGGNIGPVTAAEFAENMRQLLVWHRAQWPHVPAYRFVHGADPWRQYANAMSRGEWGDLIALSAASHLFGMRIRVLVRSAAAFWTDEVNFVDVARGPGPEVTLLNSGNYHFEAITPIDRMMLRDPNIEPLAEWEAISAKRNRAGVGEQVGEPSPSKSKKTTSTSGTKPTLDSAVCRWPSTVSWARADAKANPHALFLFGENGVDHHTKLKQDTTQACIRGETNAVGIRTCWNPGAVEAEGGAMLDKDFARNKKAIDEDFAEAKTALLTGLYTTLVVPWDVDSTALGIGVAKLRNEERKETYNYLSEQTNLLIQWAETNLRNVLVATRQTGLTFDISSCNPSTLFVYETTKAYRDFVNRNMTVSDPLQGANVFGVCTGADYFALKEFGDANLPDSIAQIDVDFDSIEAALKSKNYRRVMLPTGGFALGAEKKLATTSPNTDAHLKKRLAKVNSVCASGDSSALPKRRKGKAPSGSEGGKEEVFDDDATKETIIKKMKL